MNEPQVSVVIPTKNRRGLLEFAVGGALKQLDVDVQVIVVDDGSSDGTSRWVEQCDDSRVSLVRHERSKGVSAARNAGVSRAVAEWVAFLDDDDLWAPDKLVAQLRASVTTPADWVVVGDVTVAGDLRPVAATRPALADYQDQLLTFNNVPGGGSGVMARTAVVRELGGFDHALSTLADWDMWIRLFERGAPATVDRPLVAYRRHPGSMGDRSRGFLAEVRRVVDKHAAVRRSRNMPPGFGMMAAWRAETQLRAGRRLAAAASFFRCGIRHRGHRLLRSAPLALVAPDRVLSALDRRDLAGIPDWWIAEAETWLKGWRP